MDAFPFTEQEVRKKLEELGYTNISREKMSIFMKDMEHLMKYESSKNPESVQSSSTLTEDEDIHESPRMRSMARQLHGVGNIPFSSFDKENYQNREMLQLRKTTSTSSLSSTYMSDSQLDSSTASSVTKRKVARKKDGKFHVFDETFTETESEASDITAVEERLRALPVKDSPDDEGVNDKSYDVDDYDDTSSVSSFSGRKTGKQYLPSYIRPVHLQQNVNRTRKFDPVSRYHQFKQEWRVQGIPGESKHNTLRWNVREQMLNCETFEKPRHTHKPNAYEIPTGKKRQALRWEVRSALARI